MERQPRAFPTIDPIVQHAEKQGYDVEAIFRDFLEYLTGKQGADLDGLITAGIAEAKTKSPNKRQARVHEARRLVSSFEETAAGAPARKSRLR